DFADRAGAAWDDARVPVVAGRGFLDDARRYRVVVATGEQRGARRAAERRGMEAVVTQPFGRQPVHRRGRDAAAERAELAKARIVDQDQDDVRRALRRRDGLREPRGVRVLVGAADVAGKL